MPRIECALRQYRVAPILGDDLAVRAARTYRMFRDLGITIRKTADLIVASLHIEHHRRLLHDDRDFAPMEQHLGLLVA